MFEIDLTNRHDSREDPRLIEAAQQVLKASGISAAEISIVIVGNAEMQELNRRHLKHDYPTDVLSFVLDQAEDQFAGEIIASSEYAAAEAKRYGWSVADELLLYVVHGALHLVGHDDTTPETAAAMRTAERAVLANFGLHPPGRD